MLRNPLVKREQGKQGANKTGSKGFTVVELTIATGVFSILLLLSLVGFMQIGKLFYKGVNVTRTSDIAKQALNSIKGDVSFDVITTSYAPQNDPEKSSGSPRLYFCAGSNRYTYRLGKVLDTDAEAIDFGKDQSQVPGWNSFGLLKDTLTTPGCPAPFSSDTPIQKDNVTELLGDKMRLSDIEITQLSAPNDKLYTIRIKVAYGDNEVLQDPESKNPTCKADSTTSSSFCYVADLRTIVRKGL